MPTTPHPDNHSDSTPAPVPSSETSTERKEFTITTHSTDPHPEADPADEPTNTPPCRDDACCPCGALAEGNGPCRKCRARATWERRQANRERHITRPSSASRRTPRDTSRPRGRRPGH